MAVQGILAMNPADFADVEDGPLSENEEQDFIKDQLALVDIDKVSDVEQFRSLIGGLKQDFGGGALVELLFDKLPVANKRLGRTKMIHIIRDDCSKNLPPTYLKRLGHLTKGQKNFGVLKDAAQKTYADAEAFQHVRSILIKTIDEALLELDPTRGDRLKNSEINRLALLAWLARYPAAVPWWEKLGTVVPEEQRPAFLEQPGGPVGYRNQCYSELLKLSETMKLSDDGIDETELEAGLIGEDAAVACSKIYPRAGAFKDAGQLKELHSSMMSRYADLKAKVFASGFSKDVTSIETYSRAFVRCGDGKTKDLGAFYVFCVCARREEDIKWLVRDFADTIGLSSAIDAPVTSQEGGTKRSKGLSKKELAKEADRCQLLVNAIAPAIQTTMASITPSKRPISVSEAEAEESSTKLRKLALVEKKVSILTKIRDGANYHTSGIDIKQNVEAGLLHSLEIANSIDIN